MSHQPTQFSEETHYKAKGKYYELLTRDNYDSWAVTMEANLKAAGLWVFITGNPILCKAPDTKTAYADQMIYAQMVFNMNKDRSAAGEFISRACSEPIRERYLSNVAIDDPAEAWNELKTALQVEDADRTSTIFDTFMTMKKPASMTTFSFCKKLRELQKQTTSVTTNEAGATITHIFLTDHMILRRILANANPEHAALTQHLESDKRTTLATALERYDAAEQAHARRIKAAAASNPLRMPGQADGEDVFYNQVASGSPNNMSSYHGPGNRANIIDPTKSLPVCPKDWDGIGCWLHFGSLTHRAVQCNGLRDMQKKYLAAKGIPAHQADHIYGYPPPTQDSRPISRRQQNTQKPVNNSNFRASGQLNVSQRRKRGCGICGDSGHITDACPGLGRAAQDYKKQKLSSGHAAVASANFHETIEDGDDGSESPQ
ncbi:hypothetical protein EDC01DRAFT_626180 [Geopyxis carbonaria]|nr:hypothetical protein EDC01DRAFT_626180 [Geopyxis carbonaria]